MIRCIFMTTCLWLASYVDGSLRVSSESGRQRRQLQPVQWLRSALNELGGPDHDEAVLASLGGGGAAVLASAREPASVSPCCTFLLVVARIRQALSHHGAMIRRYCCITSVCPWTRMRSALRMPCVVLHPKPFTTS